jgi:hypothetical protein
MAPMNIMPQNTIDKLKRIVPKIDSPTTKSENGVPAPPLIAVSKKSLSKHAAMVSASVNVNWAVAARGKYLNQCILASKIDYKSAYQWGTLHF